MTGDDALLTTAEVAVAFAGFASIVTAFRRRQDGSWLPEDAVRFQLMIHTSLFVLLFSLLPFALELLRLDEPAIWRAAAACFLGLGATLLLRISPRAFALARRGTLHPVVTASSLVGAVAALGLQALSLTGPLAGRAAGAYFAGLLCMLAVAALAFARMVAPVPLPGGDRAE